VSYLTTQQQSYTSIESILPNPETTEPVSYFEPARSRSCNLQHHATAGFRNCGSCSHPAGSVDQVVDVPSQRRTGCNL